MVSAQPSSTSFSRRGIRRALLLVNRRARRGELLAPVAVETLREYGIEVIEATPGSHQSLSALVRQYQREVDAVIIGGGDGTLNAAVDGIVQAQLPLGVLPMGTANDLARTLGLPTDPVAACRVIAEGRTKLIDLGQVNGKYFFNAASIGLSVDIAQQLTSDVKRVWGILAYLRTALRMLYRARFFSAEIRAGGQTIRVRTLQIAIGNGRHYGGGLTLCQDASIEDQVLDLYSLEVRRWWEVPLLLPRLKSGMLSESKYVRTMRGQSFHVTTRKSRQINTDGEITAFTPADFRVVPQALSVFVSAETT